MFTHGFMHTHGFTIPYIADGNKKCVKSAAEKESDRLRSQRYPDEHSKDPEYRVKRAKKA